jgi:co-chaperonin GroES (HSP10)
MSHGFMDAHSKVAAANVVGDSEFSEIDSPVPNGVIDRVCMFNLVVAPIAVRTKIGSIFLPAKVVDDSKWYHGLGQVKFVGEACYTGRRFEDMGLTPDKAPKVGDLVYYNAKTPARLKIDGKLYVVLTDDSITMVFDREGIDRLNFML